jgi:predicted TIM-barrel fold metal-dependent hydrolase
MIIDAHVHVKGGDIYYRNFPAEQILRCMEEAGIDLSIVFGICQSALENIALTKRVVAEGQGRLIGFAHALPAYDRPVIKDLEHAITVDGMRGIKMHAGECGVQDYIAGPVLVLAADLGVPCLIDVKSDLTIAKRLAEKHPRTSIIFPHLGGCSISEPGIDGFIQLACNYANVYLDTSYQALAWKIGDAIERAGAGKIIWGSDGPLIHPALELQKVKILQLPKEDEDLVLSGNIARLIGLEWHAEQPA